MPCISAAADAAAAAAEAGDATATSLKQHFTGFRVYSGTGKNLECIKKINEPEIIKKLNVKIRRCEIVLFFLLC